MCAMTTRFITTFQQLPLYSSRPVGQIQLCHSLKVGLQTKLIHVTILFKITGDDYCIVFETLAELKSDFFLLKMLG